MKNKLKDKDLDKVSGGIDHISCLNFDLDVSPVKSDKGAVADQNTLPEEIRSK